MIIRPIIQWIFNSTNLINRSTLVIGTFFRVLGIIYKLIIIKISRGLIIYKIIIKSEAIQLNPLIKSNKSLLKVAKNKDHSNIVKRK